MKNIAIIFGGKSVEHDISIITALQVVKNLPKCNLIPVYIKSDGKFVTAENLSKKEIYLDYNKNVVKEEDVVFMPACQSLAIMKKRKIKQQIKIDCAILCNHGHGGEDGSLQGYLDLCEIPYTSCDVASSAICMDKVLTKIILKDADISTPAYIHFNKCEYDHNKTVIINKILKKIKLPCIIKPARLGSSVGIGICETEENIETLIEDALQYDDKVIVEKFVENAREFCCAVMKNQETLFESKVSEVKKGKIFTFEEKYLQEKESQKEKLTKTLEKKVQKLAKAVYSCLGCDGVVRVDFLYDKKNDELYVNEVNSIPGSLAFNLFNTSFKDLLNIIINESIFKKENKNKIIYQFNSSAIKSFISLTENMKTKI